MNVVCKKGELIMEFTPTKWSTSAEKEKFFKKFVKFVESDFDIKHFPKWFYERLSNCFGHIAHYNREGFYEKWFSNMQCKYNFILNARRCPCFGSPSFTYSDVEQAIVQWLDREKYVEEYEDLVNKDAECKERELYYKH